MEHYSNFVQFGILFELGRLAWSASSQFKENLKTHSGEKPEKIGFYLNWADLLGQLGLNFREN